MFFMGLIIGILIGNFAAIFILALCYAAREDQQKNWTDG